jgi:hypothetical protein
VLLGGLHGVFCGKEILYLILGQIIVIFGT